MNKLKRNLKILNIYKEGKTLEEIGKIFHFTRSRAQQIIIDELKKKLLSELGIIKKLTHKEKKLLEFAVKEELHNIFLQHKNKKLQIKLDVRRKKIEEIKMKMSKLPDISYFFTVSNYARALEIKPSELSAYCPEIVASIVNRQKKRWSRFYNQCRNCKTTTIKHAAHGLCWECYVKSDIYKDMQESSRSRNIDKWRKKQSEYAKEYKKRPNVIARIKKMQDVKFFSGNREKAIKRDNYKCTVCSLSKEDSYKKYNRDLYVKHIDGESNNLDNLATLCFGCFQKKVIKIMQNKIKTMVHK